MVMITLTLLVPAVASALHTTLQPVTSEADSAMRFYLTGQ